MSAVTAEQPELDGLEDPSINVFFEGVDQEFSERPARTAARGGAVADEVSIHQLQAEQYDDVRAATEADFDALRTAPRATRAARAATAGGPLQKRVVGWHPYWMGTAYQRYDYSKLSTIAYFSYEVNPTNGSYVSLRSWDTTPIIAWAHSNNVKVVLTATLFGSANNQLLLTNSTACQNLINSLVSVVSNRNGDGVNIDFESVSGSMKPYLTAFLSNLTVRFHRDLPDSEVSLALPAVDWSSSFDVAAYDGWLDYAIIMGYDYYWRGSSTAGPVSPLRASATWGTYCIEKSIDDYLAKGLRGSKLLLGCPYYGYDWPTTSGAVPSTTTGTGTAELYSGAKTKATTYGRQWNSAGSVPYYIYTNTGARQCWYDDAESLGQKYDMVVSKGIGGIGIWALGYDDYLTELWDLIGEKFASAAAADWQAQDSGTTASFYGIGARTNRYAAVGAGGMIRVSPDGQTWTAATGGVSELLLNAGGLSGTLVAVGDLGRILTSPDGLTWTARTSGTSEMLRGLAWGNNIYVACGNNGAVIRSTDASTWTAQSSGTNQTLQGVLYAGGQFVMVGAGGVVLTSPDGITWTPRSSGTTSWLLDVAYGNGVYVVVGLGGVVLSSPDGITWTARASGTSEHLYRAAYGSGKYVAVGTAGTIISSTNVTSWAAEVSGTTNMLRGVIFTNGQFVAVGYNGTILTSGSGDPSIAVTTLAATVSYATTNYTISGTANAYAVGTMRWTNSLGGSGTLAAATAWSFSAALAVGTNTITVTATNAAGRSASASVDMVRQADTGGAAGEGTTSASQPGGGLSDIVVYCSAGHGFTGDSGSWITGRGLTYGMVEDIGNVDQLNYFVEYCFRAGATVVPMRPVGNQTNEVVIDNTSGSVTWGGTWYDSASTIFYGTAGATPYRYAYINTTSATAWAIYRPTIPVSGFYPVYAWTRSGSDRVKQLYRVYHSGGVTDVRVNHRRVGLGWVWLGTYYFNAGTEGSVNISNHAPDDDPASNVVIADAIRFGNGMGDINRGYGVSGFERELEASRYWVQKMVGQGMSSTLYDLAGYDDNSDNVGAPVRMAAEMNRESDGGFWDRIYLGFHSNADGGAGTARGPMGLYDTRGTTEKQDQQKDYGTVIAKELTNDLGYGQSGVLFPDGYANNSANLYGSAYGELYGTVNGEMNSTIIETAFHNNSSDANLLKCPSARRVMAMASYQAIVKHLCTNNAAVSPVLLPDPPTRARAVNSGSGAITVSWQPPVTNVAGGHAATGYILYRSTNGFGFGNPVTVSGGAASSLTLTGMTAGATYYFQVCATNRGGESLPSKTVGARVAATGRAWHLVVNGFERNERNLSPNRYFANNINGNVARVIQRRINSFDYVVQHGQALTAAGRAFDSCDNGAVVAGDLSLGDYFAAYWILGRESTANESFSSAEQTLVMDFLNPGRRLFVSGSEVAYDLDYLGSSSDKFFLTNYLKVAYAADDSYTNVVTPKSTGLFSGVGSFYFDNGNGPIYKAAYPDVFLTRGSPVSSVAALVYSNAESGAAVAGIQYSNVSRLVVFGFPFETILSESVRTNLMARTLAYFGTAPDDVPLIEILTPDQTLPVGTTVYTVNGTANELVAGTIRWTNRLNSASGGFTAATTWATNITLAAGTNVITFHGRNASTSLFCTATCRLTVASTALGDLQVTISPAEAVADGAQWRVDGGSWLASGTLATGLVAGVHTVSFNTVTGWTSPTNQPVTILDSETTASGGLYTRDAGSLSVLLEPPAAVSAGAQWNANNGAWQDSGATLAGLAVGTHTVRFSTVSGFTTPGAMEVSIAKDALTTANGTYTQGTAAVTVTLLPAGAVGAGAQWRVDGGSWQDSGATVSNLSLGAHAVSFDAVSGWGTPGSRSVTLSSAGENLATTVTYGAVSDCPGGDNAQQTTETEPNDRDVLLPGEGFTKTWTLKNTGPNTWTDADGYELRHVSGEIFGITSPVALEASDEIASGQSKVWSVTGAAPAAEGEYRGVWMMYHGETAFGDPVWIFLEAEDAGGAQ